MILAANAEKGNDPGETLEIVILAGAQEAPAVVDADDVVNRKLRGGAEEGGRNIQGFQVLRLRKNGQGPLSFLQSPVTQVVDGRGYLDAAGQGNRAPPPWGAGALSSGARAEK